MSLDPIINWLNGSNLNCNGDQLSGNTILVSYLTNPIDVKTLNGMTTNTSNGIEYQFYGADILITPGSAYSAGGSGYYINDSNHPYLTEGFLIPDVNTLKTFLLQVTNTIGTGSFWPYGIFNIDGYPPGYLFCTTDDPSFLLAPPLMSFANGIVTNPTITTFTNYDGTPQNLPTPPNISPVVYPSPNPPPNPPNPPNPPDPPGPPGPLTPLLPSTSTSQMDWLLVGGIAVIIVIVILALIFYLIYTRRRRQT